MGKKCPPGVFCIENYTLGILIFIILGFLVYIWNTSNKNNTINNNRTYNSNNTNNTDRLYNKIDTLINTMSSNNVFTRPDSIYTTNNDVLLNPYSPPNRDDRPILQPINTIDVRGMPINIRTQGVESSYRQVGILTRINGSETILPLMGRPLIAGRDTWNFYTMSDQNNMVKLPITFKNKNCTGEYGCDNIYNGDTVYVEGYNDAFKVTMYENNTMRYIPYI